MAKSTTWKVVETSVITILLVLVVLVFVAPMFSCGCEKST